MKRDRRVKFADRGRTVILERERITQEGPVRRIVRRWLRPVLMVGGVFIAITLIIPFVRADILEYYAGSCLGTWENVVHAVGKPQFETGTEGSLHSENSARFSGGDAQIFCGSFSGDDPGDKVFKKARVSFVWSFAPVGASVAPANSAESGTIDEEIISSTSSDAVASTSTSLPPEVSPTTVSVPEEPPPGEPPPAPAASEPPPPSSPSSSPTTWLRYFVPIARADVVTSTSALLSTSTSITHEAASSTSGDTVLPSSTLDIPFDLSVVASSAQSFVSEGPKEGVVQVNFSLDGKIWNALGSVHQDTWHDASYELPLNSWEELKELQINIQGLPGASAMGDIFLDGIVIEVTYETQSFVEQLLVIHPASPPPSVNEEGPRISDPASKHFCDIEPFSQSIRPGESVNYTVVLRPSGMSLGYLTQLGELSPGITASIASADMPTTARFPTSTKPLTLIVSSAQDVASSSLNFIVLYSETQGDGTALPNFCQYNLIIE
ncbi:MAG: hypothetical protein A2945_01590 [Candidatus Liptonbacteria bacterium RIFCSPLOWO2_01_FULL_52_25]|uniref:Uncharacterized protein n=1 Tax=Candidatus Liptonbacteria bacterium RIFCSPLOWO2_01_FULL_52_25 TaxID=1798650 RepID=A0A1G2CDQ7_9BACT|nr:MAG: hypothetical protein A2945_01590 [Candidatus Liptonbacteria bacterium RIFCSPLOWO2_01_FULL_52_25]